MAVQQTFDERRNLVVLTWKGVIEPDQLLADVCSVMTRLPVHPPFDCLCDAREAKITESLEPLKSFARRLARRTDHPPGGRTAIVAPTDHEFGVSRMFASLAELGPVEFHAFRQMAAAREWLGLPQEKP